MDLHLDILLNLPNVSVFTCYDQEGFKILQLDLLNDKVGCIYCEKKTGELHQNRPILIRDLSICGQGVYLKVPRRQIYCHDCQKYSTRFKRVKKSLFTSEKSRKFNSVRKI